jgi:chromosomal replication initiator protein
VLYVSAEEFMNEMINSIRYDKMQKFREKYRNIDSLLIDDIQFIAGKERTQEEFFHTFNTLHDSGKQIVVTSDKFPKDIPNLEGRLRSRFEWGLIADIQPPEIETKVAIVDKKAHENNITLPKNVAYYIASKAESNIRELEGFIIRIGAYASLTGREIDMELVKEVLKKFFKQGERPELTVEEIMKTVAAKFNIRIADLKSQKKNKNLVIPRQIAMYLARKLTSQSFPDIGAKIGGKDHSTVIYANNKIRDLLDKDAKIESVVREIEDSLNRG